MLELTPELSVTVGPLVRGTDVRLAVRQAAAAGVHSVQLSAATRGLRPRELDRRARRDVLALLSRHGIMLGGVDLMIPHKDWLRGDTQDRALAATLGAIELAAEWGRVPLSMTLPVDRLDDELKRELLTAADGHGVTLAVHAEHDVAALKQWLAEEDQPVLAAAVDPATVLAKGEDPAAVAMDLARWVRVARLDDYATVGGGGAGGLGGRCALGDGELDVVEYRAALAVCTKLRAIVLELRDVPDPRQAMMQGKQLWERTGGGL